MLIVATFILATGTIIGVNAMKKWATQTDYFIQVVNGSNVCVAVTCALQDDGLGFCSAAQLYSDNACSTTLAHTSRWKP